MRRHTGQRGAGLIMLIGVTAVLAVLAASLVMLLSNQQGATAKERSSKTSLDYAEAALNSAITAVKLTDSWLTTPYSDAAAMTAMNTNYETLPAPRPAVTYRVYDDAATISLSTPAWDENINSKVWVQVTTTYLGRTTRLRQMVASTTASVISRLPKAAAFCGGAGASDNITMTGSGDVYVARYDTQLGWGALPDQRHGEGQHIRAGGPGPGHRRHQPPVRGRDLWEHLLASWSREPRKVQGYGAGPHVLPLIV
jgi:Tfp pilus assembly protein PilX